MARRFITKRDIEDYARAGVKLLELDDNTVITDEARQRASDLGVQVRKVAQAQPLPPAPLPPAPAAAADALVRQVRAAVIAQLGAAPADLDAIIARVLGQMRGG